MKDLVALFTTMLPHERAAILGLTPIAGTGMSMALIRRLLPRLLIIHRSRGDRQNEQPPGRDQLPEHPPKEAAPW